jgi:AcrR family transcriptional regulator
MPRAARAEASSDTRERILEAALEAFAENGFDGSKTRDIAARARVTLGLVQYYYGSKLDLWKAAVDHAFGEMAAGLEALVAGPEPADERERLARLIRAHVTFVSRHPEFARMMHEEGKRRGPRMRWLVDRHVKIFHQAEECKRVTGVDPTDPAVAEAHAAAVEHLFLAHANEETSP